MCKWVRSHEGEGEGVNVRYPSGYSKDKAEKRLGIWVNNQRQYFHRQLEQNESRREMFEKRREMLENLPGWTWTRTPAKESNFTVRMICEEVNLIA